jgi:hypothetical protein
VERRGVVLGAHLIVKRKMSFNWRGAGSDNSHLTFAITVALFSAA